VITRGTEDPQIYNMRALAFLKTKQYDYAIGDYGKVISLNPKFADAYHNRGIAYANTGKYDEAIEDYNKAVEIKPKDVNVYVSRAVAYVKKATADFKRACDLGNKNACDDLKELSK
jgi:tetratricopeptide (TPR) repeat protein